MVFVCVFFPSSHHDASSNSWSNPLVLFLRWYSRGCECVQHIIKWEKTSSKRSWHKLFVCTREQETDQARLGAVWVRGEAWATADKLVNEQTWRPPCGTVTSFPPSPTPTLRSSSAVTLASTVLLTSHLWFDWNFTLTAQPLSPLPPGYMLIHTEPVNQMFHITSHIQPSPITLHPASEFSPDLYIHEVVQLSVKYAALRRGHEPPQGPTDRRQQRK